MTYTFDTSKHSDTDYILKWVHDHAPRSQEDCEENGEDFWTEIVWKTISDGEYSILRVKEEGGYNSGSSRKLVFAICKETDTTTSFHESSLVKNAVCYFQIKGYYSSYEGTEWDKNIRIVTPELVTTVLFK